MIEIWNVDRLLNENLRIPNYQRPYRWSKDNVCELLSDLQKADFQYCTEYRIGTVILHRENVGGEVVFNVVDGQQRIMTLILLKKFFNADFDCKLLGIDENGRSRARLEDATTQKNLRQNFKEIESWFKYEGSLAKKNIEDALNHHVAMVVIVVDKVEESFQLFDSQNSRGKPLDPHDLLKAYHLREIEDSEQNVSVEKWQNADPAEIRILFNEFLFPVYNWCLGLRKRDFTSDDIDVYKGVLEAWHYSYCERAQSKAFQIMEPFVAGKSFFEMVDHYLLLKNEMECDLKNEMECDLASNECFKEIGKIFFNSRYACKGFEHTQKLFKCILFLYYDRFHKLEWSAVKILFVWAMLVRVRVSAVSEKSINKYVSVQNLFAIVVHSRQLSDIKKIALFLPRAEEITGNQNENRKHLLSCLKEMMGEV